MSSRQPIILVVHQEPQMARQIAKIARELAEVVHEREVGRVAAITRSNVSLMAIVVGDPPEGVSPLDVLTLVKEHRPNTPRLLLVEPGDLSVSIVALHDGIVDHILTKPLREKEVAAVIHSIANPRTMPATVQQALCATARSA